MAGASTPAGLLAAGDAAFDRDDFRAARELYLRAERRLRAPDRDSPLLGEALNDLAAVAMAQGKSEEFRRYFAAAREQKQRRGGTLSRVADAANLLVNGGFEDGLEFPWGTGHYERSDGRFRFGLWWNSKNAQAYMKIDCAERHGGRCSLRVTNYSPLEPHVFTTLSQRISQLTPNTVYRISYYAKARDLSAGAASIAVDAAWVKRLPALPAGSYDWRSFSATVNSGHNDYLDFRLIHQSTGTFWLDDVVVQPLMRAAQADPFQRVEALYDAGKYPAALAMALDLEQRYRDDPGALARSQQLSGRIYHRQGHYQQALERLELAVQSIPRASMDLADVYYSLGDYETAGHWLRKARAAVKGDQGTTSLVLNQLSRCDLALGRLEEALRAQQAAYHILKHIEDVHGQAEALFQLGVINQRRGDDAAARTQLRKALAVAKQLDDPMLASELQLRLAAGAWRSGASAQAGAHLAKALSEKQTLGEPLGLARALSLQGRMLRDRAPAAAVLFGKQAVNLLQRLRADIGQGQATLQMTFVKDKADIYQSLADMLIDQGRLAEAQQVLGMLKEEEYFDFLERDAAADPRSTRAAYSPAEQPWLARYQQISAKLAALGRQLGELRDQAGKGPLSVEQRAQRGRLRADLVVANKAFDAWLSDLTAEFQAVDAARAMEFGGKNLAQLRPLQSTLRRLGHGAVLLHYLITPTRLRIILTTPEIQLARDAPVTAKALHRQIMAYRGAVERRSQLPREESQTLYAELLGPVEEDLRQAGAQTLMLSLDGALRYLPVATLHDGKQYVVERYAVASYTEAARNTLERLPQSHWRVAGLGVSESLAGFSALPAVPAELERIVRHGADDDGVLDGVVLLNSAFTGAALLDLLDAGYPVVHIASHFVFSPGTERSSYLLLGDGRHLDLGEIRSAYDFSSLDLLTLSACNTALADAATGREIEGLGTLAQNRGAKGVLATLWPVSDASTAELMGRLYDYQSRLGLSKAEALRQAQRDLLQTRRYQHPYYWGAFILMGNWL